MLKSKKLDDQNFEDIMEYAIGRLPYICPDWTDYNAHDPGITILELMAWYKETQQYRLDVVTDDMRKKLLKLAGITPLPPRPARCRVEIPADVSHNLPVGNVPRTLQPPFCRLTTDEGILFELVSPVTGSAELGAVFVEHDGGALTNVSEVLRHISISPFGIDGGRTSLVINIENVGADDDTLRFWFEIDDDYPVKRNPFRDESQVTRKLEWEFLFDTGETATVTPQRDETHALCQSGYVVFKTPDKWKREGEHSVNTLKVRLADDSSLCLEDTKIKGISLRSFDAVQQETLSYIKKKDTAAPERGTNSRTHLYTVSVDPEHRQDLCFSSTGLPNMKLRLDLGNRRKVLTEKLILMCDTMCEDGVIRKQVWRYTDNLSKCGARDRVFTLDKDGTSIVFGNGEHGGIVPQGSNTITIVSLVLSFCEKGNIPKGTLNFVHSGEEVTRGPGEQAWASAPARMHCPCPNTRAVGGRAEETVSEAIARLNSRLNSPSKCVSKEDYERAALRTPGLRVAAAKAIPYYDPREPSGRTNISVITIVAVPYSETVNPMPDDVFMLAVSEHMESLRPICTKIIVMPPLYIPVSIAVQIRADENSDTSRALREVIRGYLAISENRQIGDPVVRNDLISVILGLDYVYKTERLDFYIADGKSSLSKGLDVILPKNGIAYLENLDVTVNGYK